jgi:hypothetical protein
MNERQYKLNKLLSSVRPMRDLAEETAKLYHEEGSMERNISLVIAAVMSIMIAVIRNVAEGKLTKAKEDLDALILSSSDHFNKRAEEEKEENRRRRESN